MLSATSSIQTADMIAPRDHQARAKHYRDLLVGAHRTIETLQIKMQELEFALAATKREKDYAMSLCVTRTAAEEARLSAFRLAREKAAILMENPDDEPTNESEAIRAIRDPKPKWTAV
ncbi:hypothetical protein [Sinorhizobium medicae]|uniref:hypothetical protein n=1 Tax=Sinorhizobium medicae TaxID=110321 RepID=UPI000C7BB48B|nr:hypothetical protein [Sinorhizobium medicae]MDX0426819.1 hypothetical protein [Sinorhizobium medicae]PLU02324.1 hypothetical protein BMJ32_12935 [Sinorhizobium medicae]PLU64535.1 hypothetical protein BMJ21_22985 [Sinorhizobium medicae]TWA22755.1 hypothetical protein FB006_10945 [Sinorhizobium medicae]TWA43053.1 hypothetical protein FB005_10945 [Sinorhizobium medicae]